MPLSGGTFTRLYDWTDDRDAAVKVRADKMDAEFDGIAAALSKALYNDGQQVWTAAQNAGGFKITSLGTPSASTDAATKAYVDSAVTTGTRVTVRIATTANVTIATALNNGDTLDGVVLATNDLVLVKNQTAAAENGIYVVDAVPARSTSFDAYNEHVGSFVSVTAGTAGAGTLWICMANTGGTINVTAIDYSALTVTISYPISVANGGTGQITANLGFNALAPTTSRGDTITRGASVNQRLALGAANTALISDGTDAVWGHPLESLTVACSDESTALTTGTAKVTFRMPYAFTLTGVRASLTAAQTSGTIFTVDINEGGTTIISTKLTIDNNEKTSTTAATPAVISDTTLADDALMTVDIDQIGNGTAKGLKITLIGRQA